MSGRTMVRWRVGIGYFPFFLAGFAADFFADFAPLFAGAFALAEALVAFFAGAFSAFGAAFFTAFLAGAASTFTFFDFFSRVATSVSATGASVWPIAPASMSTTSDQSK